MARKTIFAENEYYHCYCRGTDKRKVFLNKRDYLRFSLLLYVCNNDIPIHISNFEKESLIELFYLERGEPLVSIGAYCLMPNHFHILLKEIKKGGISKFMQKVMTGYTMYFNKKYERTGSLFESRFKSKHLSNDRYLKYTFSYIHLNPIKLIEPMWKKQGIKDKKAAEEFLKKFEHSSYLFYKGISRPEDKILDPVAFPKYFKNINSFDQEIYDWLSFPRQG